MTSDHPHQDFMMYNLSNVYLALCDQPGTWNRHPLREQPSGSSLCSGSSAGHMCQLQNKKIKNYISIIKSIRSFLQIKRFQKANHNHYSSIWSSMRWDWIYCEYCKELVLQRWDWIYCEYCKELVLQKNKKNCNLLKSVLLSNDKNSRTHFPRSFLSVAQRSGAEVGAAEGPSQPSWLQIHLSENMTF